MLASVEGHDADDNEGLSAYGDAVDLAARVPTLMGALVAGIAAGLVYAWRWAWRKRQRTLGRGAAPTA
jgi:hypothetical protein